MGEWSKTIGEKGEAIVADLLELIGWSSPRTGVCLDCNKTIKHANKAGGNRRTHGIDFLYTKPKGDVLESYLVSSKYTANEYPNSLTGLFKEHFKDLAQTISCFKKSSLKKEVRDSYSKDNLKQHKEKGVLFWLANDGGCERKLALELDNLKGLSDDDFEEIYLIDNYQASFLYSSILYVKNKYRLYDFGFYYPDSISDENNNEQIFSGDFLPIELINSPVLLFKLSNDDEVIIVSCINEVFDGDELHRVMGLMNQITKELASKVVILFSKYDELRDVDSINQSKQAFSNKNFTRILEVGCFKHDFRAETL